MSDLLNLLNGDRDFRRETANARNPGTLFQDATWDQVGTDKTLTDFLHKSIDPNGSKYGGNSELLKQDLLNTQTARGSSAIASIWDAVGAHTEGVQKKQFENLLGRLYEQAPNRLASGNLNDTAQALGAGLVGAVGYDLPLNLLFGAGTLSKLGVGGGKAALEVAGRSGVTTAAEDAVRLANAGGGEQAVRDAIAGGAGKVTRDLTIAGAKQGAATEAIGGAAGGFLGDVGQQDAAVQRGLQDEISLGSTVANTVGGAALGGVFGGVGGAFEGRGVAKELTGNGGIQREMAGQQRAISNGLANDIGIGQAPAADATGDGFVTFADAYREIKSNLHNANDDLSGFTNEVIKGDATSRYTPEQLDVLRNAVTGLQGSGDLSESFKNAANTLRSKGDPESILAAQDMEQRATAYQTFVERIANGDLGSGRFASDFFSDGDISPEFVSLIARFDRQVAEAFSVAKTEANAGAPANTAGGASSGTAKKSTPGSSGEPAAAAAATEQVTTKTEQVAATPPKPVPDEPTAVDVQQMAESSFAPEDKQALTDLNSMLAKAGIDLQAALDSIRVNDISQVAADVGKAEGNDRAAVQSALEQVTGAVQKERSRVDGEIAAANEAAAAKAAEPAPEAAAPAAEAAPEVTAEQVASTEAALESLSTQAAALNYNTMAATLDKQVAEVGTVLDTALEEITSTIAATDGKLDVGKKVAIVAKALEDAVTANPELAPILERLDPTKLTSKKGVENAKVLVDNMAKDAIAFTYSKVIGDILPDALNVDHFDSVLSAMLRDAPSDAVTRISAAYRKLVNNALVERINAIGIENVQKDAKLSAAWQRIVQGSDGYQPFGGKTAVTADIGSIINKYADQIARSVKGGIPELDKKITNAGKVVRDFMNQLQASGIPMDSQFMQHALEMKALHAVDDIINGVFEIDNKEAFEKLGAMRDLRARDRAPTAFTRTSSHARNPFFGSMVENPVLSRIENEDGSVVDQIITGRSQPRGANGQRVVGRVQGILSDGISDYLGTIWASPRKMFAAAGMARRAIYGAAVDVASWSRGSLMIDGVKFSGSMKELKGLYAEKAQARMEQARFGLILDAAERKRLPETDPRYFSKDQYDERIARISSMERGVTDDEKYVSEMMLDHQDRIRTNNMVVRSHINEILADSADMGESAGEKIAVLVAKANDFFVQNDRNLVAATNDVRLRLTSEAKTRSGKTGEGEVKGGKAAYSAGEGKREMANQPGTAAVAADGSFVYGTRDIDPVVKNVRGEHYEFVPRDVLSLDKEGNVFLFGEKVGAWKKGESRGFTFTLPGMGAVEADDITSLVRRGAFLKQFQDKFDAHVGKLAKAASSELKEGDTVAHVLSETKKVVDAQNELIHPTTVKAADADKRIDSFDVPDDRVVVFKRKSNSAMVKPGQTQTGMSVREFLAVMKLKPEDVEVGSIPAGKVSKAGKLKGMTSQQFMLAEFTPLGRDTGKVNDEIVKAVASKKENAPLMVEAKSRPLSYKEAGSVKVDSERTLADVVEAFDTSLSTLEWGKIPDLDTLNVMIASFQKQADLIESVAPMGLKRNNASRRQSFHWLQERMAGFSAEEKSAALDMLRRLDSGSGQLPYFLEGDRNSFAFGTGNDTGKSGITLGQGAESGLPKHAVVAHELGHWAFVNMLSPSERVQFLRSLAKHYPASGGPISADAIMATMPNAKAVEAYAGKPLKGAVTKTNELFAWQFTNYAIGNTASSIEDTLWQKVAKKAKGLLQHFLGQPVDKDLAPLFEKILPSTISERKFNYDVLIDRNTGVATDVAKAEGARRPVTAVLSVMSSIDELRGRLAQNMLMPGSGADGGFASDLEAAAKHMFGLMYGKEANVTVTGLRAKLNPFREEGDWKRGADGKVVKVDGKGVRESIKLPGAIDPRELFSRSTTGKLMQAIRDVLPEGTADNIAFEAAVGSEQFNAVLKATSIGDNPEVSAVYNQTLERKFTELVKGGMKQEDALEAADLAALKDAADYAKTEMGIDIESTLFDNGVRYKLGGEAEQEALGGVARKLYDLMSDSLDHLEGKVNGFGYEMQRMTRELPTPTRSVDEVAAEKAVAKEVAKIRKPRAKKVAPTTEASATVVVREESQRVDGNQDGVPDGAPALVKTLISKVPHRDKEQADIIGTLMHRVFSHILGDDMENVTNADIAKLAGVPLEDGVRPESLASSTTAAFDELRRRFRLASEELTNSGKKPEGAIEFVIDMLARHRAEAVAEDMDMPAMTSKKLAELGHAMANGKNINARGLEGTVFELVSDAADILAGLGKTAEAKRTVGPAVATPATPVSLRFSDGSYHPAFAKSSVMTRLAGLPRSVAAAMLENVGLSGVISKDANLDVNMRNFIGFVSADGRKTVFTTVDEMVASMADTFGGERLARLDAEIAKAASSNDGDEVARLMEMREATAKVEHSSTGGVIPVLLDFTKVYDPMMTNEAQSLLLSRMVNTDGKKLDAALKELGYIGTMDGERLRMFSVSSVKDMEKEIAKAVKATRSAGNEDAPLLGEIGLNLALDESLPVNALATEQRALQAGATPGTASLWSRLTGKRKSAESMADGITEAEAKEVRHFSGLQFMDNASRIRKAGGEWLGNLVAPVEGTGFFEGLMTKMSSSLSPVMADLDKMNGVTWWKRPAVEIRRNMDHRGGAPWQSEMDHAMTMAMRTNDVSGLELPQRAFVAKVKQHFKSLLVMQQEAGIPVADVTDATNEFYLPQRFNTEWIRANREDAISMLGEWFAKDRKASGRTGDAMGDARRVINEALNREELQGIIDGTSSTYAQAFGDKLHSRKLNIVGADWQKMGPMFDNSLRSLLVSYTEAAHKRVEWANRFGVKGHAADTYVDIADRGSNAAMDAFMGKASAMKYVRESSDDVSRDVEFTSSLFTPMAKNEVEAGQLTALVTQYLADNGKAPATREGLVEALTQRFIEGGGQGADHFKKRAEAIVNGLADFGDEGGTVAMHERDFMLKMTGTLGGRPAYTISANQGIRQMAAGVKTFNSVTLLGGALFSSLADPTMSLLRSGSGSAWLKGTSKAVRLAMGDPATADAMMRIGVAMQGILSENLSSVNGGLSGRISNSFFQATLLTPWTAANRQAAALVGFESIKANQVIVQRERFSGNLDSWAYRKSMRYLRQLGLAHLAEGEKLDTFAMGVNDQKVAEAVHKFVSEAVFEPNRNDSPLWTQDPIASIFWQFKSYPMMMGRLVKHNIKEAFAMEGGKYAGDPAGLMYLMTVGAAAGVGALAAKDYTFGKNEGDNPRSMRDYRMSKIAEEFGFKDAQMDNETLDLIAGAYTNGLLSLGALGFLGDLVFQSAKQVDNGAYGRERIMSQIAGPTLGTFSDSIQILEGARQGLTAEEGDPNEKARTAVRKVLKRIPGLGQQVPLTESWVDAFAGESQNPKTP